MDSLSQDAFFAYLEVHNCSIMKITKYGYFKFRNNRSGKVIGIQPSVNYYACTIIKICHALRIPIPPELKDLSNTIISLEDKEEGEE